MKNFIQTTSILLVVTLIVMIASAYVFQSGVAEAKNSTTSTQCYLKAVTNLPSGPTVWHCVPDGNPSQPCDSTEGACGGDDSDLRYFD